MPILPIAYFILGIVQLAAYLEGVELWLGFGFVVDLISFVMLALAPLGSIVAAAVSFYGAYRG